jgi:septal ring factor EnvC (AmiA/AmiB activator)
MFYHRFNLQHRLRTQAVGVVPENIRDSKRRKIAPPPEIRPKPSTKKCKGENLANARAKTRYQKGLVTKLQIGEQKLKKEVAEQKSKIDDQKRELDTLSKEVRDLKAKLTTAKRESEKHEVQIVKLQGEVKKYLANAKTVASTKQQPITAFGSPFQPATGNCQIPQHISFSPTFNISPTVNVNQ